MGTDEEWHQLSARVQGAFDDGQAAFKKARDAFFAKFGGTGDVPATIAHVNAYYASLTAIDFPPKAKYGPRPGQGQLAHPAMVSALGKAVSLLEDQDPVAAKAAFIALSDVGTLSIRANVNTPSAFSLHSFGWAIDLDPLADSNVARKEFPESLFTLVTGLDIYGPQNAALRVVQPYAKILPLVRAYRLASDTFRAAFASQTAFAAAIGYVFQTGFASPQAAGDATALIALARAKPLDQPALQAALAAHGVGAAQLAAAVAFLVGMCTLFAEAAALKKPAVEGNAATVAKFGFVNLHAELIAALMAQDGGNLIWLGDALGTKDPMHFELRPPYPPLF